jgi:polysaccharide export outer membrane protein
MILKKYYKLLIYTVLIMLAGTSCKSLSSSRMFKTPKDYQYSEFKTLDKEYKIKPFDELDVKIYTNKGDRLVDITGKNNIQNTNPITYTVEYDGKVKLPTIGRIDVNGLTVRELETKLENEYKKYFVSPFVLVKVTNRRVLVFSAGSTKAQVVPMENDNFTLIEALAKSGGISDYSKAYKIKLLRGDLNNPQVFIFKLRNIEDMKNTNFLLRSNDIIYVEERARYGTKLLAEVTPYLTLFTSILTVYLLVK